MDCGCWDLGCPEVLCVGNGSVRLCLSVVVEQLLRLGNVQWYFWKVLFGKSPGANINSPDFDSPDLEFAF